MSAELTETGDIWLNVSDQKYNTHIGLFDVCSFAAFIRKLEAGESAEFIFGLTDYKFPKSTVTLSQDNCSIHDLKKIYRDLCRQLYYFPTFEMVELKNNKRDWHRESYELILRYYTDPDSSNKDIKSHFKLHNLKF